MTYTETRLRYSNFISAMQVDLPAGKVGDVEIRPIVVSEEDAKFSNVRSMFQGGRGRITAGTYTGLYRRGGLWMSDTPDERYDHVRFVSDCYSRDAETVLVGGLGLGMVVNALLILPSVKVVTVIEIDPDVVELVGPELSRRFAEAGKELEIITGDAKDPANTLAKGRRWDAAWMDIWQDLCTDNLDEMASMSRRYGRRVGFQGYWGRELLRSQRRREQRMGW